MVNIYHKEIKIGWCLGLINWIVVLDDGTEFGFSEKPIKIEDTNCKHTREYDTWHIENGTIIMLEKGYAEWHFEDMYKLGVKPLDKMPYDASIMWGINHYDGE